MGDEKREPSRFAWKYSESRYGPRLSLHVAPRRIEILGVSLRGLVNRGEDE